jgi:hypothetical protein
LKAQAGYPDRLDPTPKWGLLEPLNPKVGPLRALIFLGAEESARDGRRNGRDLLGSVRDQRRHAPSGLAPLTWSPIARKEAPGLTSPGKAHHRGWLAWSLALDVELLRAIVARHPHPNPFTVRERR